ncbi:MAG: DUF1353 domain-containing protein [Planctomycetes bacterium]|nr:DUF1353 domain-containing protein [Planctomycetota bacterium]
MAAKKISYRSGYKYQLATAYPIKINIKPKKDIDTEFIKLKKPGDLTVARGYAWDGPSGPVVDTRQNLRASLVHDALYQLMRHNELSVKTHKDKADKLFKKMCIEDGISKVTAQIYYLGLKLGGKPATDPQNKKKTKKAP